MTDRPVHVVDAGEGPVIVLLHGYLCSASWFGDLAGLLTDRYRVVRLDLRGHGLTGGSHGLDSPDQARMVADVLDRLRVPGAVVVGHSFGADVAVDLARTSQHVKGLVILAQAPDYSYASFPLGHRLLALPFVGAVLRLVPAPWVFRRTMRFGFAPGFRIPPDLAVLGYADFKAADPHLHRVVLVDRAKRLSKHPLDRVAAESGLPRMAILGELDSLYDAAKTAARYEAAGFEVKMLRGVGHSPNVESPERVAALLDDFVSRCR